MTRTADADPAVDAGSARSRPTTGHRYRAYGLAIQSDLALPELEPDTAADARIDVAIRLRTIERPHPDPLQATVFELGRDHQYLAWRSVGRFLIRGSSEIDIDPAPGVGEPLLRLPLLGTVMALLLHVRGLLVLHASAVAVGETGVVFLGDKLAGKSTTAAAFLRGGHRLLADDVVAVDFADPERPRIRPGFPQLKLGAGIETGAGAVVMPPVVAGFDKRHHRLAGFQQTPAAATAFCILERGTRAEITPLAPAGALTALIRFSYIARFGRAAFNGASPAAHLQQCATLVGVSKVCRLEVPDDRDRLDEVVRLVEREVAVSGS